MKPLLNQRLELPFKAVLIQCLDENRKLIPKTTATGFIRKENGESFIYTCWHVVTGYDRNELKVSNRLPNRAFLEVQMQDAQERAAGVTVIGGLQSVIVPLYDTSESPKRPLWLQDKRHIPHPDLNLIHIHVPFWHDAVKIKLPEGVRASELQIADNKVFPPDTLLAPGDKLYIVGFPYGYSSHGMSQPMSVVLTRFVASTRIENRQREVLLESAGAPGMSGGPVFVERNEAITLLGLYTGLIYPDHMVEQNEKVTALGTCSDLTLCWWGALEFVQTPTES